MEKEFKPELDGWDFHNWREEDSQCAGAPGCILPAGHLGPCELSWDLYAEAYPGVNKYDSFDLLFYETCFKKMVNGGNCGGMSFLALALFKYGGYRGYCSPASFYEGKFSSKRKDTDGIDRIVTEAPVDVRLHRLINILSARQFASRNVMNVIDIADDGNMANAEVALKTVKEHLANGDYVALAIAQPGIGNAHTVIPYKVGTKVMHIWDPNHPYSVDSKHYDETNVRHLLYVNSPQDWDYNPDPTDSDQHKYWGALAWCYAMPLSLVLEGSRQPISLEYGIQAFQQLFLSGAGSAVSQIADGEGHGFYADDRDISSTRKIETDPNKRLKGIVRWPWFNSAKNQETPELYFLRRPKGNTSPLVTTINGFNYQFVACMGNNIIEINSTSNEHSREVVKIYGSVLDALSMEVVTSGRNKKMSLNHLLAGTTGQEWRRFKLDEIELPQETAIKIDMEKKMNEMTISCPEKGLSFSLEIQQRVKNKTTIRSAERISTVQGKVLRLGPEMWKDLGITKLIKDHIDIDYEVSTAKTKD
jgi:hypothetical protein